MKGSEFIAQQLSVINFLSNLSQQFITRLYNLHIDVKEYGALGVNDDDTQGIIDAYTAIVDNTDGGVIAFTMGNRNAIPEYAATVGGVYVITEDIIIPSQVGVYIQPGVTINIASGKTVTFNGPVSSIVKLSEVFIGSGSYVINYEDRLLNLEGRVGNMAESVYDPTGVRDDAFDMDNMAEGVTNLILTSDERSAIAVNTTKPRKNLLDNSNFQVWQDGTSFVGGTYTYSADRWRLGGGTPNIDRISNTMTNSKYSLQFDSNGVSSNLEQRINPTGKPLYNKQTTLSFWAKSDINITSSCILRNVTTVTNIEAITVDITTSPQKFEITFDASTGWNVDDIIAVRVLSGFTDLNAIVEIADVKFEIGANATEYESKTYDEELEICRYYYYVFTNTSGSTASIIAYGFTVTTGSIRFVLPKLNMRATPTFSKTDLGSGLIRVRGGGNSVTVSTGTFTPIYDESGTMLQISGTFATANEAYLLEILNYTIAFSARL